MTDGDRCRMGRYPLLDLRQNDEDGDDANDGDDDDDYANDDDDAIDREFFSPAPISLTGNYWPRCFFSSKQTLSKAFNVKTFTFTFHPF